MSEPAITIRNTVEICANGVKDPLAVASPEIASESKRHCKRSGLCMIVW